VLLADRGRADYVQNRWSAARFGPRAKLIHPDGSSYVPAAELGAELLELVRPAARALGGAEVLARLDPARCEADLQLEQESAEAAAADLVTRSLG
jgi:gamma-glutamyl:cysteine ligase YbdK (ATP-grasp superfamily)